MEPKLLNFFDNEINAQEIKAKLADVGIECFLESELKTQVNVLTEPTENGVTVYVDKKDYSKAKNILHTYEQELEVKGIWCPECESEDVTVSTQHMKYKPTRLFGTSIIMAIVCCIVFINIHNYYGNITLPRILGGFIGAFIGALLGGIIGYDKKGYDKNTYYCNKCGKVFSEKDRF